MPEDIRLDSKKEGPLRTLLIDNYDSFTFNIAQCIARVNGEEPMVIKNDELSFKQIAELAADNIVVSAGPGTPQNDSDLGVSRDVIRSASCPLLGVCLGFQGIAWAYGSDLARLDQPWHGRGSQIVHDGSGIFEGIPSPFLAIRYHSLYVSRLNDADLTPTAFSEDGLLMALKHRRKPMWAVQFHPESISSDHGLRLFLNFRDLSYDGRSFSAGNRVSRGSEKSLTRGPTRPIRFRRIEKAPRTEAVFQKLYADRTPAVWLDSSAVIEGVSRFSFIADASHPSDCVIRYRSRSRELTLFSKTGRRKIRQSIFDFLKSEIERERAVATGLPFSFCGGYIGYFGYELKGECGGRYLHESRWPDAYFLKVSRFLGFDHQTGECFVVALGDEGDEEQWLDRTVSSVAEVRTHESKRSDQRHPPPTFRLEQSRDQYIRAIRVALEKIRAGESYQVCLTNRLQSNFKGNPLDLYRVLRRRNAAPFSVFLNGGDFSVLGASPERFLKIDSDGKVQASPIKGTRPRSADSDEDNRIVNELLQSPKDRSENLMIVDLLRNDLGRVAKIGSVHVPVLMKVDTLPTLHHIVSTVQAELLDSSSAIDCVKAAFPGGSMTGAPKVRTMQIIDGLESSARGVYSGALGYLSLDGSLDLSIVIRTAVVSSGQMSIGIGGGVVTLSDPDEEFEEAMLKGQALIDAAREYFDVAGSYPAAASY